MKKLLIGLLALSAVSFAASNPGDNAESAKKDPAGVGVPMEVRVNILPADGRLILVDENNKLIDKLVFDHGSIVSGMAQNDSMVEKTVKLKIENNGSGAVKFGKGHGVTFIAKNAAGETVKNGESFMLNGHGAASGSQLVSKLVYREDEITTKEDDTEYMTKVQSIIPATEINKADLKSGLYVGTGTFEATVKKTATQEV